MSGVRITLLCEDSQTDSFVRRFLSSPWWNPASHRER